VNILNSDAENTPPAMALSRYGVVGNLTGYPTFYTDSIRPEDIVTAVARKEVDVAIAWGPLAGYFAAKSPVPLLLRPMAERDSLTDFPFRFSIGMGVRRRDRALRDSLQTVLDHRAPEIQAILKQYNVPVFPIPPEQKPEAKATPGAAQASPDSGRATNR
jgi:mxaJ protein